MLSKDPRGLAIPVSLTDSSVDQVLAAATTVQNKVPDGSTWDGKSDLPMDEGTFRQMMSDVDPKTDAGAAPGATGAPAPAPAAAPSPGSVPTAPAAPATATGGAAPSTGTGTPSGATPTSATPVAKPRSAGPPVTSAAGSQSKSTE